MTAPLDAARAANLITDVAGLRVGNAADPRLKSGATVLTADAPFVAAVDVRGGAPGTRETDLLAPGRLVEAVDAIVLAGGSAFGLDAASGVMDGCARSGAATGPAAQRCRSCRPRSSSTWRTAATRDGRATPIRELGAAAFDAAAAEFAIGSVGAGTGAMTATLMGGLGSASLVTEDGATVGALAAVNAFGSATVPGGRAFWAGAFEIGDEFGGLGPAAARVPPFTPRPMKPGPADPGANTTIAIVATDAALDKAAARRMAEAAQDGLARAIHPAHTPFDGDLVFAVATGARPPAAAPALDIRRARPRGGALPRPRHRPRRPRRPPGARQPAALLEPGRTP